MRTQQKSLESWKRIKQFGIISVWKTPTKYAVVFAYERKCFFYSTLEDAVRSAQKFSQDE